MVGTAEKEQRCIVGLDAKERKRLYRAVNSGKLISPFPQLYVRLDYWAEQDETSRATHMMRALQLLHPDWVFAGPSAGIAWGLWVSYKHYWPLRIVKTRGAQTRNGLVYRQLVADDVPTECDGIRVTSLKQTVIDCLREMDFACGLAVADSVLRMHGWSRRELVAAIEAMHHGCAGYQHALATAPFADARSESGGESIMRARLLQFGYKLPDLQVVVKNTFEGITYRGDVGWKLADDTWLLGELDGKDKYVNPIYTGGLDVVDLMRKECLRESRVSADGTRVMRLSFADVMNDDSFTYLLDLYGVPKALQPLYASTAQRYRPAGLEG